MAETWWPGVGHLCGDETSGALTEVEGKGGIELRLRQWGKGIISMILYCAYGIDVGEEGHSPYATRPGGKGDYREARTRYLKNEQGVLQFEIMIVELFECQEHLKAPRGVVLGGGMQAWQLAREFQQSSALWKSCKFGDRWS